MARARIKFDVLDRCGTEKPIRVVDFSKCTHLKPYSVACICALAERERECRGTPPRAIPPRSVDCADHLARLDVPRFFETDWPCISERDSNLRVRRVRWPPGNEAREIVELLVSRDCLAPGVLPEMESGIDEVIRNALTHAESGIDCIVAGQAFDKRGKVEVAIVDLGQTVLGHLSRNPEFSSLSNDREAIFRALEEGVTGTPAGKKNIRGEHNSGAGLANLREYCESGGGELTVLSGHHWVTCSPEGPPVTGRLSQRFGGCLVNIRYFTEEPLLPASTEPIL